MSHCLPVLSQGMESYSEPDTEVSRTSKQAADSNTCVSHIPRYIAVIGGRKPDSVGKEWRNQSILGCPGDALLRRGHVRSVSGHVGILWIV